jgi:hypothetical protein
MAVKQETLAHVWDVMHYVVQLHEISEVTFTWYRMKALPNGRLLPNRTPACPTEGV